MRKQNSHSLVSLFVISTIVMACNLGGSNTAYKSTVDKFSVNFPSGGNSIETKSDNVKYAMGARTYTKSIDNRSDNYRSYEVQVLDMSSSAVEGKTPREIMEIALNGWENAPETSVLDIKVDGKDGIDSLRTINVGKISMTFRDVVFWSEANKKLYVVKIAAIKRGNTTATEAENFIKSFKIEA